MTRQTWRAERFRSADVRRSTHQRATKDARKRRREDQPVNKTDEELDAGLEFLTITIFLTIVFIVSYLAL